MLLHHRAVYVNITLPFSFSDCTSAVQSGACVWLRMKEPSEALEQYLLLNAVASQSAAF